MEKLIILDLDGTLYNFDNGDSANFASSRFYKEIKARVFRFVAKKLKISQEQAKLVYEEVLRDFNQHGSIGFEKRFGINRYEYFENTWNLDPSQFIGKKDISSLVQQLGDTAILTAAPRVWANRVIEYLGIKQQIKAVFTGELDIRKPSQEAFLQVCDYFSVNPEDVISVGDQLESDILPAKALGMKTVLVRGKSEQADICIDCLEQLPEAIRRLK